MSSYEIDTALKAWFTPEYIKHIRRDGNAIAELERIARENNTTLFAILDEAVRFAKPKA